MNSILGLLIACIASFASFSQAETALVESITYSTADGAIIEADLFGNANQAVILAHGTIFNKESWHNFATDLAANGLTVLAINFRGYGKSTSGKEQNALYQDILGAIRYLNKEKQIKAVSVLGASMGGGAAAQAAISAISGSIEKLVLLSPVPVLDPEKIKANTLYIVSKNEGMFSKITAQYEKTPEPKQLIILEGNAHAQHIFKTNQSDLLTENILTFLKN